MLPLPHRPPFMYAIANIMQLWISDYLRLDAVLQATDNFPYVTILQVYWEHWLSGTKPIAEQPARAYTQTKYRRE